MSEKRENEIAEVTVEEIFSVRTQEIFFYYAIDLLVASVLRENHVRAKALRG